MKYRRTGIVAAGMALALVVATHSFAAGVNGGTTQNGELFSEDEARFLVERFNKIVEIYNSRGEPEGMYSQIAEVACDFTNYLATHPGISDFITLVFEDQGQGAIRATHDEFTEFLKQHDALFREYDMSDEAIEFLTLRLWWYWGVNDEGIPRPEVTALTGLQVAAGIFCSQPQAERRRLTMTKIVGTVELVGGLVFAALDATVWAPIPGALPVSIPVGIMVADSGYDRLIAAHEASQ